MKRKIKKIGIAILLLLAVTVGTLSVNCTDTKDALHVSSEKMVVKAATKKQKVAAYNKKAKKAYKKFLKSYYVQGKSFYCNGYEYKWSDNRSKNRQYSIRDINHDGKLELLIYNTGRPEEYLFTYYKNEVKCLSAPGYHSGFYQCKKGKIIIISSANNGSEYDDFYLLQKGELKSLGGVFIENKYTGTGRMKNGKIINEWSFGNGKGKTISRAQFKKILKKYTGSTDIKAFVACYIPNKKVKTQLKEIKYKKYKMPTVKKVTGIKVKHKLDYNEDKEYDYAWIDDVCKITWNKSVAGNVQVTYATNKKFSDKKTKTIKASTNKNYCLLENLYAGETYYIKLRTYIGDKCAYSKYSKVYKITMIDYQPGVIKNGDTLYYAYSKNKKCYMCQKDLKTNKVTKIISSDNWLRLNRIEGKYMYYSKGTKSGGADLYVCNLDTKKEKLMLASSFVVGEIASGKVFCRQDYELVDFEKADLYSFDLDGTNKKKVLENIFTYFIYNNQLYWYEIEFGNEDGDAYKLRRCDLEGENKVDITEWIYVSDLFAVEFSKDYTIEKYIEN